MRHNSIEVKDISLTDYIQIRHPVYVPHTAGRYAKKQFKKSQMPIVERLVDRCVEVTTRKGDQLADEILVSFLLYPMTTFTPSFDMCSFAFIALCPSSSLMMNGRNNGKKLLAVRIVAHAFEIIHLLTDQNPIQVLVDAIVNTGPREDSTRIGSQGTVRRQAVDVSPLRRVNQAIALLTIGVRLNINKSLKRKNKMINYSMCY